MKRVVLFRHGIAEPHGEKADEKRELTKRGRERLEVIAPALATIFPKVEAIFTSPLTRCIQTSRFIGDAYSIKPQNADVLRPETTADAVRDFIASRTEETVVLVGHEPSLSRTMLKMTRLHADASMELKRGGLYLIRFSDDGDAHLEWMLAPRVLRRLT